MPEITWIKITTEMFDDEKVRIIEGMPEADTIIVIWVRLICMAGKVNEGGYIYLAPDVPYSVEQLASIFNRPLNTVKLAMETFVQLKMIELRDDGSFFLINFEKHQNIEGMARVREATKKRVQAFRKREKVKLLPLESEELLRNVTVTQQNRIEKNREDKKRNDEIWNKILLKIQSNVNQTNFNAKFKDTVCLDITESEIVIGVRREDQATYLEDVQRSLVETFIAEETGLSLELKVVLTE